MVEQDASDLYFTVGAPPHLKVEGITSPIGDQRVTSAQMAEIAAAVMNEEYRREFDKNLELNMAISLPGVGRFRVNVFRQRSEIAMVIRYIKGAIPGLRDLRLPAIMESLIMELRGLILVVGASGSGKSTTLASMIDFRNENTCGHILTIEDPIEYLYKHKKSLVDQREVGIDTLCAENAMKNAIREAPDVIMIGEILEENTLKHAISYAQTGHLCLSTMHSNTAVQSLEKLLNFFSEEARQPVLLDLAVNLRAIIALRLVPGLKHQRVPAVEILINTPYVADLIENNKLFELKEVMSRSRDLGMQTFDQSLVDLYREGSIDKENAMLFADSKNNVGMQIRLGVSSTEGPADATNEPG